MEVECACAQRFCFACGEAPHAPCTCPMIRQWRQKWSTDERRTTHWLNANSRPCPKCSSPVERNGGCNLVMCRCRQCFCWLCGQATRDAIFGLHACGRYREDAKRNADAAEARKELERWSHYYTRWWAHADSQKLESATAKKLRAKIDLLEERSGGGEGFAWLLAGQELLFRARRCLSLSYVFAFFAFGGTMFGPEEVRRAQGGIERPTSLIRALSPPPPLPTAPESTPLLRVRSDDQNTVNQNLFEESQQELEGAVERCAAAPGPHAALVAAAALRCAPRAVTGPPHPPLPQVVPVRRGRAGRYRRKAPHGVRRPDGCVHHGEGGSAIVQGTRPHSHARSQPTRTCGFANTPALRVCCGLCLSRVPFHRPAIPLPPAFATPRSRHSHGGHPLRPHVLDSRGHPRLHALLHSAGACSVRRGAGEKCWPAGGRQKRAWRKRRRGAVDAWARRGSSRVGFRL